jgi:hypothetical protein
MVSSEAKNYKRWYHLAADCKPEIEGNREIKIINDKCTVYLNLGCGDSKNISIYYGLEKPNLSGWISHRYGEKMSTYTICDEIKNKKSVIIHSTISVIKSSVVDVDEIKKGVICIKKNDKEEKQISCAWTYLPGKTINLKGVRTNASAIYVKSDKSNAQSKYYFEIFNFTDLDITAIGDIKCEDIINRAIFENGKLKIFGNRRLLSKKIHSTQMKYSIIND